MIFTKPNHPDLQIVASKVDINVLSGKLEDYL